MGRQGPGHVGHDEGFGWFLNFSLIYNLITEKNADPQCMAWSVVADLAHVCHGTQLEKQHFWPVPCPVPASTHWPLPTTR